MSRTTGQPPQHHPGRSADRTAAYIAGGLISVAAVVVFVIVLLKLYGLGTLLIIIATPFLALVAYKGTKAIIPRARRWSWEREEQTHRLREKKRVVQPARSPEQVVSRRSKDRAERAGSSDAPVQACPYCHAALKNRKWPTRRSTFKCPRCMKSISVDPHQWLYPSPYLTEEQAGYVGFLWQLDHWVFARGSRQDYEQMRAALRRKLGRDPNVRDVIWGLMNLSCSECAEGHAKEIKDLAALFPDDRRFVNEQSKFHPEVDDLRALMVEFRQFEREVKKAKRGREGRRP